MADEGDRLLRQLMRFKPDGMTANAWAVQAGVGRTIWADLRRHGNPSRRTLEKLLSVAGSSLAEFEALRVGKAASAAEPARHLAEAGRQWGQAPIPPLPLLATAPGGAWGDHAPGVELLMLDRDLVVDRLARPPSMASDRDAYALTIVGESMWPRFRVGRRVAVSPAAAVGPGDDVLAILAGSRHALIGESRSRTAGTIGLRQFNPAAEFDVPAGSVAAVHKILGELI